VTDGVVIGQSPELCAASIVHLGSFCLQRIVTVTADVLLLRPVLLAVEAMMAQACSKFAKARPCRGEISCTQRRHVYA